MGGPSRRLLPWIRKQIATGLTRVVATCHYYKMNILEMEEVETLILPTKRKTHAGPPTSPLTFVVRKDF